MVGFNPYHLSCVSGVQRAQWWPGYLSWSCSSANNSTKSDKSLDFSMLPLPYLFRLQPSVAYCVPAWHSRTLPEFYFSTLGGSVSLGSDVSFHSIVYAVRLAPLKLGWLPQVLRNRGTAWEVLGRTFSQRCLRNIEQGLVPLLRRSGCLPTLHLDLKCQPICPGSYWRLAHLVPRWKFPTEPGSRRRPNDGLWRLFPIGTRKEGAKSWIMRCWFDPAKTLTLLFLTRSWAHHKGQKGHPTGSHNYGEHLCWMLDIIYEV